MVSNTKDIILEVIKCLWLFVALIAVVISVLIFMRQEGKVKTGNGTQFAETTINKNRK